MSLRILTTPIAAPVRWPAPRDGGVNPGLLDAFICAEGTAATLERLRDPATLVVTTGQQPGLLTGPMYTVHKALSAVAMARLCEARWGRPVVPVFWAAGGDHDFAEGNHASWPAADGTTVTMTLRERAADAPLTPLYREPVGPEIVPVLDRLAADLPPQSTATRCCSCSGAGTVPRRPLPTAVPTSWRNCSRRSASLSSTRPIPP